MNNQTQYLIFAFAISIGDDRYSNSIMFQVKLKRDTFLRIDWGDNSFSTINSNEKEFITIKHTYPKYYHNYSAIKGKLQIVAWSIYPNTLVDFKYKTGAVKLHQVTFACCPFLRTMEFDHMPAAFIMNCPVLKELRLGCSNERFLRISGCPKLRRLFLKCDDKLEVLDLSKADTIEELHSDARSLESIRLSQSSALRKIVCNSDFLNKKTKVNVLRIVNRNNNTCLSTAIEKPFTYSVVEHIRLRPQMYIGASIGNSMGIYNMLDDLIMNAIEEHEAHLGAEINICFDSKSIMVSDNGHGISADYLNDTLVNVPKLRHKPNGETIWSGWGLYVVSALSSQMVVESIQDGKFAKLVTSKGVKISSVEKQTAQPNGTAICIEPDSKIFGNFAIDEHILEELIREHAYCNPALHFKLNSKEYNKPSGMLNLLEDIYGKPISAPAVHIVNQHCDIAIAPTYTSKVGSIRSYVNGKLTPKGGTHVEALKKAMLWYLEKDIGHELPTDFIEHNFIIAMNIKIEEPFFENQIKDKLACEYMQNTENQYIHFLNPCLIGFSQN